MDNWIWIALSALSHAVGAILAVGAWKNRGPDGGQLPGLLIKAALFFVTLGLGLIGYLLKVNF